MTDLTTMTDDDLDTLRVQVLTEQERRRLIADAPAQQATVAGIGHWLTSLDSSPSGLTQRHAYEGGGLWAAAWDTGGDVTSWSATQVGPTAAAWSWLAASIQLIPN